MHKKFGWALLLPIYILLLTGCLDEGANTNDLLIIGDGETQIEPLDPNTYVCDPFNGEDPGSTPDIVTKGLKATLYYREDGQPRYYSAQDYFDYTTEFTDLTLYLNQLNVPTRPFDRGFVTQGGQTLTTLEGDTLYEYFALDVRSRLTLAGDDLDGDYQIAILSDDGAVLEFDYGSGFETHINNDGDHPTKMKCGTEPVALSQNSALPFRMKYYQGPRYHISLVVLYRPWDEATHDDPYCDRDGNSFFFDSTKDPVEPTWRYEALLNRGWKVLTPDHYLLPDAGEQNPCTEPETPDPEILDINLGLVTKTSVVISWTTNTATTSQLQIVNQATGVTTTTDVDLNLVTEHVVSAGDLSPNSIYEITAISTDPQGRSVTSPLVTVRTRR
ncbi:MAG: fibronectin type III domain-containing protein [Bdellovibrionales bacterium]